MSDRYTAGDVVWAPDPFKDGSNPRPWLVLAAESVPFAGEEYLCAGLTLSDQAENIAVGDDWITGNNPDKTSYCSPWTLGTIKHDSVISPQGKVTDEFTATVLRRSVDYLTGDVDIE